MNEPGTSRRSDLFGFAIGVGLGVVATLGVYWRFWQPGTHVVVWVGGSFLIGAALGAAVRTWRRRTPRA